MPTARLPIDAAHRAATADAHAIGAVTGLADALAAGRSEVLSSVTLLSTDHPATWTADAATDVLTSSAAHGLTVNTPIAFGAGTGALPAGLSPEPEYYYVIEVPTATTLKVSLTYGGTAVDITDAGTAGWVVRLLPSGSSEAIACDVSLDDGDIDIYWNVRWAASSVGAYPLVAVSGTSVACMGGWSSLAGRSYLGTTAIRPGAAPRKYNIISGKMSLRKLATGIAHYTIDFGGRHTDNPDLYTNRVGLNASDSGIITYDTLTTISMYSGYATPRLSGATATVVRRP